MPAFKNFQAYFTPKILLIFVMGIASGLPLLLTISTMTYWLAIFKVDVKTIGLFGLVGLPYTCKFLWAPLVNQLALPCLTPILGQRKSWLFSTQILLGFSIFLLGVLNPKTQLPLIALTVFSLAFFSATQDIIIDAYRIEYLDKKQQGLGAASTQLGYRLGCIISGAGVLIASDYISWSIIYSILAVIMFGNAVITLFIPETQTIHLSNQQSAAKAKSNLDIINLIQQQINIFLFKPLLEFLNRKHAVLIIILILSYKIPDAYIGFMVNPFLTSLNFTGTEIGAITKFWGVLATSAGAIIGAIYTDKKGVYMALLIGAIVMSLTNLAYLWVFYSPDRLHLVIAIGIENLAGGFSGSAFVVLLSLLCNKNYTATQYALFTSLMSITRIFLGPISGLAVNWLSWKLFFLSSLPCALPALFLLWYLQVNIKTLQD